MALPVARPATRRGTSALVDRSFLEPGPRLATALALVVLIAATVTRLAPLAFTAIWGSDTGEYHALTERLVATGEGTFEYDGWGIAYPYFPGMFLLTGAVVATTGADLMTALEVVVPALSGLVALGVLLVTHRATGSRLAGILAGAAVAVTAPNVMTTSHAMPGSLGHVLLVGGLLAVLHAYDDKRHLALLAVAGAALVLTHHLSTYFLVGIIAGGAFLRELTRREWNRRALGAEVPAALALVAGAAAWWLGVAGPFRDRIVGDVFDVHPAITAGGFLLALAALPALVLARRRLAPAWEWRPRVPGARRALVEGVAIYAGFVVAMSAFIFVGFPGTNIRVTPTTIAYVLPPAVLIALAVIGARIATRTRDGFLLVGWAGALLVSLAFAAVTKSTVLFPYRHLDYLMEPVAALAGVAIVAALAYAATPRVRGVVVAVGVAWLAVSAAMAYPPREALGGFEEAISAEEVAGVEWVGENLPPGSTIAADHRVSSLLYGLAGMRATWDYTYHTYHAESWEGAFEELRSLDIPSGDDQRIDYVFLSPAIREGVTLVQWENSKPMSDAAYAKFFDDPEHFEHLYGEDGVHVFRVRWENA